MSTLGLPGWRRARVSVSLGTAAGPLSTTAHHLLLRNSPGCLRPHVSAGLSGMVGLMHSTAFIPPELLTGASRELPGKTTFPVELQILQTPDIRLCILECHLLAPPPIPVCIYTHTHTHLPPTTGRWDGIAAAAQLSKRSKCRKEQVAKSPWLRRTPSSPAAGWGVLAQGVGLGWAVPQAQPSSAWMGLGGSGRRKKLLCRQLKDTAMSSSLPLIFTDALIAAIYLREFNMQNPPSLLRSITILPGKNK